MFRANQIATEIPRMLGSSAQGSAFAAPHRNSHILQPCVYLGIAKEAAEPRYCLNTIMITLSILRQLFPGTPSATLAALVDPINQTFAKCEIDTKNKQAAFLAQVGHESAGFTATSENLNYSADRLRVIFPKYFPTVALAETYARQPAKIANRVYANRMSNGPETSGDGFRFRGGGALQLTGKTNYTAFAKYVGMTVEEASAYIRTPMGSIMSAGWYWTANNLNEIAEKADMTTLTKRINGGLIGLEDRVAHFKKALALL